MSSPGVLVTRPAAQAAGLAAALADRGYTPILAPCLERHLVAGPALDLAGVAAVAVSSANGVAALAGWTAARHLRLIAVGAATAGAARQAGFERVETAGGDGAGLADFIAHHVRPAEGRIVHVTAQEAAVDLAALLAARGFQTDRVIGYAMAPVPALARDAVTALQAGLASAVLLMSARTTQVFGTLAANSGAGAALRRLTAVCLSPAVVEAARPLGFSAISSAEQPTQASLIDCLCAVVPSR